MKPALLLFPILTPIAERIATEAILNTSPGVYRSVCLSVEILSSRSDSAGRSHDTLQVVVINARVPEYTG